MNDQIEVRNECDTPLYAAVCRDQHGRIYVHVSDKPEGHWTTQVKPQYYECFDPAEVEM